MKIRNGFVSNSSSSSFIVTLDEKPNNVGEMFTILFGNSCIGNLGFDEYAFVSADMVAERVFNDLKSAKPLTFEDIFVLMCRRHDLYDKAKQMVGAQPDNVNSLEYWKIIDNQIKVLANEEAIKFVNEYGVVTQMYCLEYEDDTPLGSVLDYGDVLGAITSMKISHH